MLLAKNLSLPIVPHTKFIVNQLICAPYDDLGIVTMQKIISIFIMSLVLTSCCWVHKMDIEQGNIITQQQLNHLHLGMSRSQVISLLGTPVLLNTFNDDRMDYVYTFKPGNGYMMEKYVVLTFKRGSLRDIKTNCR